MQPPPRKGKATSALRNVHNDQLIKLQMKHQQDVDFLDDIRNFTKLRSAIEKEYAQALLKLATTYLQKKLPTVPEVKRESGESYKTIYAVWKTMLDETEKIAKARLAAAEVYQQQVSESAKSVRMYKLQVAKKEILIKALILILLEMKDGRELVTIHMSLTLVDVQ